MKNEYSFNIQAAARSDKRLMSSMVADNDHIFVSVDLTAGEPTIISHYSGDENYIYANLTGVGKLPFYNDKDVLMIDDIYLMVASINPCSKDELRRTFETSYDGKTGFEKWLEDPEFVRGKVKKLRKFNKTLALGLGYGMGPRKIVTNSYDNGFVISREEAKQVYNNYWNVLFPKIAKLRDFLSMQAKKNGCLINPFGFRVIPEEHKALNYTIQSSVNGIIDILMMKFFSLQKDAKFTTIIHDEIIFQIPKDKEEEARRSMEQSVKELNELLNWSVKIRTGWQSGPTMYETH